MDRSERGALLFEYRPPRGHPMVYAAFVAFGAVMLMGWVENLLRDQRPELYLIYAAPVLFALCIYVALWPSPVRIHARGVAPSRILLRRFHRPFIAWDQVAAVYPCHYDVTGAFVSPFASSDGKVTQTGLAVEAAGGQVDTLRFTPTRFARNTRRSRGFREAYQVVSELFDQMGRPMVPSARMYSDQERRAMERQARKPFLPFFAIVALLACAAPILAVGAWLDAPVWASLPIALAPPTFVVLRSWRKSVERNAILNALSRSLERERLREGAQDGSLVPNTLPAPAAAARGAAENA